MSLFTSTSDEMSLGFGLCSDTSIVESGSGLGYFQIDSRIWAKLASVGLREMVTYLVLASGTGHTGRSTSWSTNAAMNYAGMGWERAKAAVDQLLSTGFIRHAREHTASRPRYELATYQELDERELAQITRMLLADIRMGKQPPKRNLVQAEELLRRGHVRKDSEGLYHPTESSAGESCDNPIWLPNSIVTGSSSREDSPVRRLRGAGCIWTLRLFIDLYSAQNLRDDGGISPRLLCQEFERRKIGEQGPYIIWAFKSDCKSRERTGPFEPHEQRPKAKAEDKHPIWTSLSLLEDMGLLSFVPHIFENESDAAEAVHPYGIGEVGEAPNEREIGSAADCAAQAMALPSQLHAAEDDGFEHFCPVLKTMPSAQMIGVARLTYRPHTRRTKAWFGQLQQSAPGWIEVFTKLAEKNQMATAQRATGTIF